MLNEGFVLFRNLKKMEYEIQDSHPDIKKPGKNSGYKVGLGIDGYPQTIIEVGQDEMEQLWTHREGKHNSFPVVRIQNALLKIRQKVNRLECRSKRKKHSTREARMVKFLDRCARFFPLASLDNDLWNRLQDKALRFCQNISEKNERYAAWSVMLNRFTKPGVKPEEWHHRLVELLIQHLKQGNLRDVTLAYKILVGSIDKKNPDKPAEAKIPLVLDTAETDYPIAVADRRMGAFVGCHLRALEVREPDGICSLQGSPTALLRKRFPEPNLGPLGETKLFSKNRATPCEFRYIKNTREWEDASKSFPVGMVVSADIADAFVGLTHPNLEGKTWRMVTNGKWEGRGRNKREKKDLLIIYCEEQPVIGAQVADLFGNDDIEKIDQFERDAQAVCRAFDGLIKHHPKTVLHLLTIGKADKEKKQLQIHKTLTVQEVLDAAEQWQKAPKENLPVVTLSLPPLKKGDKATDAIPFSPYPDRVVRLLSSQWVRGGIEEHKTYGPSLCLVLDLMLGGHQKKYERAEVLLDLLINRITPLMVGLFGAKHAFGPRAAQGQLDREPLLKYNRWAKMIAMQTIALLGILLNALGVNKEEYMKDAPFLVGQVLSLADTLHKNYCTVVRNGQMPNILIGTSLMRRALDNPAGALADLSERIMEYIRWAKVAQVSPTWSQDDQKTIAVKEARKKLRQYQPLASVLSGCDIPRECNDVMKSQVLLGFLASPPEAE